MSKGDGPEIKEIFTVKCGDCNRSLLEVVLTEGEALTKLKVHCTESCGGSSFLIPLQSPHKICPVEPLRLKNVVNSENREEVWVC